MTQEADKSLKDFASVPVRASTDQALGAAALRVLIQITAHVNGQGVCWPSQQGIADRIGISRQAVGQSIKKLIACGYLKAEKRYRENGSLTSCQYRILYTPPSQDDVATPQDDLATLASSGACYPRKPQSLLPEHTNEQTNESLSGDFEKFWKAYPQRKGPNPKKPAQEKFARIVTSGADPQELIAGAEA